MPFEVPRKLHYTKGALGEELQAIASEVHLLLISTRGDDPRLEGLESIDHSAKKAIILFRKLLDIEDDPK